MANHKVIGEDDIGPIFAEEEERSEKPTQHAFPSGDGQYGGGPAHDYGMTLRDWFAGQALQAIFSGPAETTISDCDALWMVRVAEKSYQMAEAMMTERERFR